jgi:hypothetical protein
MLPGSGLSGVLPGAIPGLLAIGVALLARRRPGDPEPPPRLGVDLALAAGAGTIFAALAHFVFAPASLAGSVVTGSDVGEHLFLLHALESRNWVGWSANRYPLPALLAHAVCTAHDPVGCWYQAGIVSMAFAGAGIFLWGRALAGPAAGIAALVFAGAVQDLVVMAHTVSGYPEILALWSLAAGLSAYTVRAPSPTACALAGLAVAGTLMSDARGLLPGLATLATTGVAVLRCGSWRRVLAAAVGVALPIAASWYVYNRIPARLNSLETLVETSVKVSYTRAGLPEPPSQGPPGNGYVWGASTIADLPTIVSHLRSARARVRPGTESQNEQAFAIARMCPLWVVVGLLGLGGALLLRDWRVWVGLAPGVALLSVYQATMSIEYHARYAALGTPLLVVLAAAGLRGWAGPRVPGWVVVALAAAIAAAPGPLSWWDRPEKNTAPPELRACLARVRGDAAEVDNPEVHRCAVAEGSPLDGQVRVLPTW